jgi:hypothetical protein
MRAGKPTAGWISRRSEPNRANVTATPSGPANVCYITLLRRDRMLKSGRSLTYNKGRAMAKAVSRRPLTTEARGSVPGQVHVSFMVDKVALGQVFLRVVGFALSISFHWCSINCKNW